MIQCIVSDLSRVIVFPAEETAGSLNTLYRDRTSSGASFADVFTLNIPLLEVYRKLELPVIVFTSGISIPEDPYVKQQLSGIVDRIITAAEIGAAKDDAETYTKLADYLGYPAEAMLFIDDSPENCRAAGEAGLTAVVYTSVSDVSDALRSHQLSE
ncbi:MAG: Enolase-phosphatase E1 [candidate division WS6 bacterium OLB20]|uniref:Enolase-phosphatase E1 n=1 Tax=candidate division WS6 bacterium OLB20 TaxID=1617426 RepID=A0A136LXU6_9BACT|nr:MAG: Enolase-phosphatase E1 [candidate division WS6 bacterium OLB20]